MIELLVVIVVIYILAVMLVPRLIEPNRAKVPWCLSNLRQIDLGFILFASDNHDQFPRQIPVSNGGTMEFINSEHVFPDFEKLKSYRIEPKLFICPFETNRKATVSYEVLNDSNLSYFINWDATTNNASRSIVTGDRFLQINSQPVKAGLLVLATNLNLSWTSGFHASGGDFAFADGHAEFVHDKRLISVINSQPLATNRLCIP